MRVLDYRFSVLYPPLINSTNDNLDNIFKHLSLFDRWVSLFKSWAAEGSGRGATVQQAGRDPAGKLLGCFQF